MKNSNSITTKRFVIRKSLIGKNAIITFTNKNKEQCTYNHDLVYKALQSRFDAMPCLTIGYYYISLIPYCHFILLLQSTTRTCNKEYMIIYMRNLRLYSIQGDISLHLTHKIIN